MPVASIIGAELRYIESSDIRHNMRILLRSSHENEMTNAITERGLRWKYKAKFSFRICFGKVSALEGRDVLDNISGMILAVDVVISEIEAESKKIGILAT